MASAALFTPSFLYATAVWLFTVDMESPVISQISALRYPWDNKVSIFACWTDNFIGLSI